VQLRWNKKTKTNPSFPTYNFGESKGQTHERVLIYPTKEMIDWILNNKSKLENGTRAKFYVALTRARYSSTIIYDYDDSDKILGAIKI
jgi:DNA helicase-2/ATP-dependent DNA helicase PcrA